MTGAPVPPAVFRPVDARRLAELEDHLAAKGVVAPESGAAPVGQPGGAPAPARGAAAPTGIRNVHVSRLIPNPDNPRKDIGDVSELAASIAAQGILQPLVVEPRPGDVYMLIVGHRRLAAAKVAGLDMVRVDVRPPSSRSSHKVLMVVENCHRADLTAIEKAEALGELREQFGWSAAMIAHETGFAPSTVSRSLALLELDDETRQRVKDGVVGVGQALDAVRDARAQARRSPAPRPSGSAVKPRKPVKPVRLQPQWLAHEHPIAIPAALRCDHDDRPRVGGVACGQCWEDAIRADERSLIARGGKP